MLHMCDAQGKSQEDIKALRLGGQDVQEVHQVTGVGGKGVGVLGFRVWQWASSNCGVLLLVR